MQKSPADSGVSISFCLQLHDLFTEGSKMENLPGEPCGKIGGKVQKAVEVFFPVNGGKKLKLQEL